MSVYIYNTLSGKKERFVPLQAGKIGLYVCGMTVYDFCHLGHARVLVAFDVIARYLRARGFDVHYVRNITDIDDKILQRAAESGQHYSDLTRYFIDCMHEDERQLNVLPPDSEPRATEHIDAMVAMIATLIDKGYAYQASNGDVYYAVAQFPHYGKLSNKKANELLVGARVEVSDVKRDPRDFVLWKAAKTAEVHWDSPWGPGRPGWHIECSAMSTGCLGCTFDIHGGGPDLRFPHHENEIAQSEAAYDSEYARYWMHAGAVRIDGEKMSKSLGNFFTIREILARYHPEVVRYLLINSHYRSAIHYSDASLEQAKHALGRLYRTLADCDAVATVDFAALEHSPYAERFIAAMDDDFNTPEALAVLFDVAKAIHTSNDNSDKQSLAGQLQSMGQLLGLLNYDALTFLHSEQGEQRLTAAQIEVKLAERLAARKNQDYALADRIRAELASQGVVVEDNDTGSTWRWQ